MKIMYKLLGSFLLVMLFVACDSNHLQEFSRIDRDDIAGYEAFIAKYPMSSLVDDTKERIAVAKENQEEKIVERDYVSNEDYYNYEIPKYSEQNINKGNKEYEITKEEQERRIAEETQRRLIAEYGNNSLSNGSQPYRQWYGYNEYIDDYTPHSEIQVKAPSNSDVIVIVRYNNQNGKVAAHKYIKAGYSSTLYLKNDNRYQTFFYYGKGWYPEKEMSNGVKGGFVRNESFSKDGNVSYLNNNVLSYELQLQENGNFQTSSSNETEMF